jgi:pyruvate/2-oxoglutarate dehydrogenase complex dihydrolipoamide acyltransferase (E2) component
MANKIQQSIEQIASTFVTSIVQAIVEGNVGDLAALSNLKQIVHTASTNATAAALAAAPAAAPARKAPKASPAPVSVKAAPPAPRSEPSSKGKKAPPSRRIRRSSEDVQTLATQVADYVNEHPGIAVSEIATGIGADINDITRPVSIALEKGLISKKGEKRLTRYFPPKGRKLEGLLGGSYPSDSTL